MTHTPISFTVKGFNKAGICIDSRSYDTPKLSDTNGHWTVCQRMAITLGKNKKVKAIRYYMDNVEYTYSFNTHEFIQA